MLDNVMPSDGRRATVPGGLNRLARNMPSDGRRAAGPGGLNRPAFPKETDI